MIRKSGYPESRIAKSPEDPQLYRKTPRGCGLTIYAVLRQSGAPSRRLAVAREVVTEVETLVRQKADTTVAAG